MTSLFNPNDVRLITPELVLTLSAFVILGLSVLPDTGRRTWAPVLASLACVSTLASLLAFVWNRSNARHPRVISAGASGSSDLELTGDQSGAEGGARDEEASPRSASRKRSGVCESG